MSRHCMRVNSVMEAQYLVEFPLIRAGRFHRGALMAALPRQVN